jgi:LmbE family N-acetylglucosaminyl deacetylase
MAPTVILSPHFDDAVLSCWRVLSSPGDVEVVNVFAGAPADADAQGWWDHHLGSAADAVATRAAEDEHALARAGRSARNLDFLDRQYRGGDQPGESLVAALAVALPSAATVYAPAGLGLHPDHDAVRSAALELWERGAEVVLYADLPHAGARGWPPWVMPAGGSEDVASSWERTLRRAGLDPERLTPSASRLEHDQLERKLAAVREYESQLEALEATFGRLDDPELLGYEVEWRLAPGALGSSSASASARNPAAS